MNGLESAWWNDSIKPNLRLYMNLRRFENSAGEGDPDVYYYARRPPTVQGWFEIKRRDMPKRQETPVFSSRGLRPGQVNQLVNLREHMVPAFILARADDMVWLLDGIHATRFNAATRHELSDMAVLLASARNMPWSTIAGILLR